MSDRMSVNCEIRQPGDQSNPANQPPILDALRERADNNNGDGVPRGSGTGGRASEMMSWIRRTYRRTLGRGQRRGRQENIRTEEDAETTEELRLEVVNQASDIIRRNVTIQRDAKSYGKTYGGFVAPSNNETFQHIIQRQSETFLQTTHSLEDTIRNLKDVNLEFGQLNEKLNSDAYRGLKSIVLLGEGENIDPTERYFARSVDGLISINKRYIQENDRLINENESRIRDATSRMTPQQISAVQRRPPAYESASLQSQPPGPSAASPQQDSGPTPPYIP